MVRATQDFRGYKLNSRDRTVGGYYRAQWFRQNDASSVDYGVVVSYPGEVIFSEDGKKLDFDGYRKRMALVSPYLSLYDALTGFENLQFFAKVDGCAVSDNEMNVVLEKVGLGERGEDFVGAYSTGMKQRLKYAVALLKDPAIFLVDEPSANLDESGRNIVRGIIRAKKKDSLLILATNEKEEYELAGQFCQLGG